MGTNNYIYFAGESFPAEAWLSALSPFFRVTEESSDAHFIQEWRIWGETSSLEACLRPASSQNVAAIALPWARWMLSFDLNYSASTERHWLFYAIPYYTLLFFDKGSAGPIAVANAHCDDVYFSDALEWKEHVVKWAFSDRQSRWLGLADEQGEPLLDLPRARPLRDPPGR